MDRPSRQSPLELEVADFGPIIKAKVDLRPLTVFVGPSNTGKSYLAILIYALHRHFSASRWHSGYWLLEPVKKLPRKTTVGLAEWAQETFSDNDKLQAENSIALPASVVNVIRSGLNSIGDSLDDEIRRCFGIGKNNALIRKGNSDDARIAVRRSVLEEMAPLEYRVTIKSQGAKFAATIPKELSLQIAPRELNELQGSSLTSLAASIISKAGQGDEDWKFAVMQLLQILTVSALPHLLGPLRSSAFYLPTDRTGVMHAHNVVVSAIIGSAPMTGLRPTTRAPMLSGVLADFLQQLILLDQLSYMRRKPRSDLGRNIEDVILGGSVRVHRSEAIDYPSFTYRPQGWKEDLPLMNASSMVSELAPVVLYLRHIVVPGDVLIVEEPESHLHPAMQVEFTRQLAALVRLGVRVIVTTHSEWVLEELANIVRRSELPESERNKIAGGDCSLNPSQVGAWLFQPNGSSKGSVVKEIPLDDSGLYPAGFDEVAAALHNNWAEISSRIEETE